jgi:hypothetical protein
MRSRIDTAFALGVLFVAPALSAGVRDVTTESNHAIAADRAASEQRVLAAETVQTRMVRTTAAIDIHGWILIAFVHGPDAALVREGQGVRAFSVNSRTRLHPARVTRVIRQPDGVRIEATLDARVLGDSTRYLMEIVTDSV